MFQNYIEGKCLAIGDVHGQYRQVKNMLAYIVSSGLTENRWIVFLGDFVDRGENTAATIDLLIDFNKCHNKTTFCCGNHDLSFMKGLNLVNNPHEEYHRNGIPHRSDATLRSYGACSCEDLLEKMPDSHKEFFRSLPWCVEHTNYLFVHAGLDVNEPYGQQVAELGKRDYSIFKPKWLHDINLSIMPAPKDTNKIIISGHRATADVVMLENHITIDTGAGFGGPLTAITLPEMKFFQT